MTRVDDVLIYILFFFILFCVSLGLFVDEYYDNENKLKKFSILITTSLKIKLSIP